MSSVDSTASLQAEYVQVNTNFRQLADIRFKLLGLVPALGGVVSYVVSRAALSVSEKPTPHSESEWWLALLAAGLGFLATLGVVFYDQRNTELYERLISRAKFLERKMEFPATKERDAAGGQFVERPQRNRRLFGVFIMGHDRGLALIYGPVMGAWFFPIVYSAARLFAVPEDASRTTAVIASLVMICIFIIELLRHDGAWDWLWPKRRKK